LVTGDQRPLQTNFGHWSPESNPIKLLVIKKLQQVVMMPILFDSLQYDILTDWFLVARTNILLGVVFGHQ
jgi:hypothetical protein